MPLPPSIAQVYTEESCRLILDETLTLLEDVRLAAPSNQRLNLLLANHFVSNDFRSVCCYGHSNEEVSLEEFNSLCLLPSANWTSRIDFLEDSATIILPSPVDSTFSASNYLLEQKYTLLGENVVTLLKNMKDSHPEREFINEHFPRKTCPLWSLAMLGLKKDHNKQLAVVPNLEELRRRISLSLHGAVAKKRVSPAIRLLGSLHALSMRTMMFSWRMSGQLVFQRKSDHCGFSPPTTLSTNLPGFNLVTRPAFSSVCPDLLPRQNKAF